MITYHISSFSAKDHLFEICITVPPNNSARTDLIMPLWRPGRYEAGSFAINVIDEKVISLTGRVLSFKKTNSRTWQVDNPENHAFKFCYKLYSPLLNAGSTYLDEGIWSVNPVNSCLYIVSMEEMPCKLILGLPEQFGYAGMLPITEGNSVLALSYDELADSPFLAGPNLIRHRYSMLGTDYSIYINNPANKDLTGLNESLESFTLKQMELFGGAPVPSYTFLLHLLPWKAYHGVEHSAGSVNVLGSDHADGKEIETAEILSLLSHELFHQWNVKAIRPVELQPYNFDKEQFTELHFVTEGVTTYYGELMLIRAGIYSEQAFFGSLRTVFKKHFRLPGRNHISLSKASFDSWINGYSLGVPGRKISFYHKGAIAAMILDLFLRGKWNHSLDQIMKEMYFRFGKTGIGYSKSDYYNLINQHSGNEASSLLHALYDSSSPLEPLLKEALSFAGLELEKIESESALLSYFGLGTIQEGKGMTIESIQEDCPAFDFLACGDIIISVDEIHTVTSKESDFSLLLDRTKCLFKILRSGIQKEIWIEKGDYHFYDWGICNSKTETESTKAFRKSWLNS